VTAADVSVLAVRGALDMLTAPTLTRAIDHTVVTQGPRALIFDLLEVGFLATAGIAALYSADAKLRTLSSLAVVAIGPATSRVLKLMGLNSSHGYSSLDVALIAFGVSPSVGLRTAAGGRASGARTDIRRRVT
jgi:anti-sigma B factor antagonist